MWDAAHGMRNLAAALANDYRLNLAGWQIQSVNDISADNLTLVGNGINPGGAPEGFVIVLPEPTEMAALAVVSSVALLRRRR